MNEPSVYRLKSEVVLEKLHEIDQKTLLLYGFHAIWPFRLKRNRREKIPFYSEKTIDFCNQFSESCDY
jgi:hypothetical protein